MVTQPVVGLTGRAPGAPIDAYVVDKRAAHIELLSTAVVAASIEALYVKATFKNTTEYGYGINISMKQSGNPALNHIAGISIYMDDPGTGTLSRTYGIDIMKYPVNKGAHSDAYMRLATMGGQEATALFQVEGKSTYAFNFQGNVAPIEDAAVTQHGGTVYKIKCKVGATVIYLLASSAPSA